MESIKYEITEQDIKDYLSLHSKDELIRFREALFVKYMKHHNLFTAEKIEILLNKYSFNPVVFNISSVNGEEGKYKIYNFSDFINNQTVDASAYLHMLIPMLKFYQERLDSNMTLTNGHIERYLPMDEIDDYDCSRLSDTIENYTLAGKINSSNEDHLVSIKDINIDRSECKYELCEYSKIYGQKSIEKIKRLVSEE